MVAPLEVNEGSYNHNIAEKFLWCLDSCGLMDLGVIGNKFIGLVGCMGRG